MCGVFFPPTPPLPAAIPLAALLAPGILLSLAGLGSLFWLLTHWLNQKQAPALPLDSPSAFPSWETYREYEQGYRSPEPKQEYEQTGVQPTQEMPPQW